MRNNYLRHYLYCTDLDALLQSTVRPDDTGLGVREVVRTDFDAVFDPGEARELLNVVMRKGPMDDAAQTADEASLGDAALSLYPGVVDAAEEAIPGDWSENDARQQPSTLAIDALLRIPKSCVTVIEASSGESGVECKGKLLDVPLVQR